MNNEQSKKASNIKVALILTAVALMISMWPVYVLKDAIFK